MARTLAGDRDAARALVEEVLPVIHARVARAIVRRGAGRAATRPVAQEVEDLVQEVLAALFDDDARALRAWDPSRGLSLANFVGLVAEHEVANIFRSGKRRPWTDDLFVEADLDTLAAATSGTEARVASRQLFVALLERLRADLSPRGLDLFYALFVEEQSVSQVCETRGMSADAVYAWRSRLLRHVRERIDELSADVAPRAARGAAGTKGVSP